LTQHHGVSHNSGHRNGREPQKQHQGERKIVLMRKKEEQESIDLEQTKAAREHADQERIREKERRRNTRVRTVYCCVCDRVIAVHNRTDLGDENSPVEVAGIHPGCEQPHLL
jgi:hypothetical protein